MRGRYTDATLVDIGVDILGVARPVYLNLLLADVREPLCLVERGAGLVVREHAPLECVDSGPTEALAGRVEQPLAVSLTPVVGVDMQPQQLRGLLTGDDTLGEADDLTAVVGDQHQFVVVGDDIPQTVLVVPLLYRAGDRPWPQRVRCLQRPAGDIPDCRLIPRICLSYLHTQLFDARQYKPTVGLTTTSQTRLAVSANLFQTSLSA